MPKQIQFDGKMHEFPDDFTDADISAALSNEVPAASPPITESGYTHPTARFGSGAVRGFARAFNPVEIARSLKATAALGLSTLKGEALPVTKALAGVPGALYRRATESPEGLGDVIGGGFAAAVPVGGIAAAVARRGVPILGAATQASRAYNIKRALRIPTGTSEGALKMAHDIETMAPEINLPVRASHQRLAEDLTAARTAAGAEVAVAEKALPSQAIDISDVTARIEPPTGQWVDRNGVMEFVPDDPRAAAAYRTSTNLLESQGGETGTVAASEALRMKRAAQGIADTPRGYGLGRGPRESAAEARAAALKAELDAMPGGEALASANRRFNVAATIEEPAAVEATRLRGMPIAGRGTEMLLGRAIPGSGFARQALAGLAGGGILDSTLFHTASAAVKRKVIDALQSGQPQLATDILFKSAVVKTAVDRRAAAALAAQGEGVTSP